MKTFIFSTTFLICGLFSYCTKSDVVKDTFYKNGNLKQREYFKSINDTSIIKRVYYYENGIIEGTSLYNSYGQLEGQCFVYDTIAQATFREFYKNGLKNGWATVEYLTGEIFKTYYINDLANGIQYVYDSLGNLDTEKLLIDDVELAIKEYITFNPGDTAFTSKYKTAGKLVSTEHRVLSDTTGYCIYSLLNKDSGKKICIGHVEMKRGEPDMLSKYNSYPIFQMPDTIKNGEPLKINVKGPLYGESFLNVDVKDLHLVIIIGKMNSNLGFINYGRRITVRKGVMNLNFQINEYEIGYNLLNAIVYIMQDSTVIQQYLMFEDFTVLP